MKAMLIAVAALGLVACGGTAKIGGGKEGAAQAFFALAGATSAGANRSTQPLDITGSVSVKCPQGGEASLSGFAVKVTGQANAESAFTVQYNNCGGAKSEAGVAVFNGALTVNQAVVTLNRDVSVDQSFKGKVVVQGAFNDFIEVDLKQQVSVTGLSSSSGNVVMKLVGTIKTSSETFTYDENVNVQAGGDITVSKK